MRDRFDESIRSLDDLEQVLEGVPPLGSVPQLEAWRDKNAPYLVALSEPHSPAAESYRIIRTSIQFLALARRTRVLLVTSPKISDGKSTTITNLAVTMARSGQRVVLVDCDLRRPRVHSFFGLPNIVGYTSVLLGQANLEDALEEVLDVPTLRVLTAGPIPPNPSEVLAGKATRELLKSLSEEADIVLIDSPPVLPVTDAVALAGSVDGTILVASAGTSNRKVISEAIATLRRVEAPIAGFILNRVQERDNAAYYRYSYGDTYRGSTLSQESEVTSQGNGRRPAHSSAGRRGAGRG